MDFCEKVKKRKPHTEYEKRLLVHLVTPHLTDLDSKRTDFKSMKRKQDAWEELTKKFNSSPKVLDVVTPKQLKKMWQNLKTKARNADTMEYKILGSVSHVLPFVEVTIDSDHEYYNNEEGTDSDSQAWQPKKEIDEQIAKLEEPIHDPSSDTRKRKNSDTIEEIKKKICIRESEILEERFELEKKQMQEKHDIEMDILRIRKQKALKDLDA